MTRYSRRYGTTSAERSDARHADALTARALRVSPMAATIAMPPADVWSFLVQMGCDRAGFYSWDRLDNGGRPSASGIHPEWQNLAVGDQVAAAPDGSIAFDVVECMPEASLLLRLSISLPSGRSFDPTRLQPRAWVKGTWGLALSPDSSGGTRLVSTMQLGGRPAWLYAPLHLAVARPAHWIMQRKQFRELQRRARARAA